MGVTAVVVTHDSASVLAECLRSLAAALLPVPGPSQVVVVDNASADGTLALARAARLDVPVTVLQSGGNLGYSAAINRGSALARPGDALLVLNPDVRLDPDAVVALLRAAADDPRVGVAVPLLRDGEGRTLPSLRREPTLRRAVGEALLGGRAGRRPAWGEVVPPGEAYRRGADVDWATGAALLVTPACRAAVGDWDEGYFLYSEETEYCRRVRRHGFAVRHVPAAGAVHLGGDLDTSPLLRRILLRSKLRDFGRRHGPLAAAAHRGTLTVGEALRAARGSRPSRAALPDLLGLTAPPMPGDRAPFVFFSAQDFWYHPHGHSDLQLARCVARDRTVLLVNSIGLRMPRPSRSTGVGRRLVNKARSMSHGLAHPLADAPGLYVLSPVILPFYRNEFLRRVGARFVRLQVRTALRRVGARRPHAVVTLPTAWDVVRGMDVRSLTVNRSDRYSAFEESDRASIRRLELELLAHADVALYVSSRLEAEESGLVRGHVEHLGHGVDAERFAAALGGPEPADLAGVPRPRVGFVGGIDDVVVDVGLLELLADRLPHAQLVLVGHSTVPLDALLRHENVHWLGPKPYEQVPSYGAGLDVGVMPWRRCEWIEYCNPVKAKEYLALGLPVVTTRYPDVGALEDLVEVADDAEEFVALVDKALAGGARGTPEQRRARVRGDGWAARADRLVRLAEQAERAGQERS